MCDTSNESSEGAEFSYPKYNKIFLQLILKNLVKQENSKSNELIKMTRAFNSYLTFTGDPPGSLKSVSVFVTWYACFGREFSGLRSSDTPKIDLPYSILLFILFLQLR